MATNERFALSLQQDLLTLITHSDEHGKTICKIVDPSLFEGDYRIIAEKAIDFWKQHDTAPKQHIADLLANILEDKNDRRAPTYRRILMQMYEVKDDINVEYVLKSATQFVRVQKAKATVIEIAELLDAQGINGIESVESLMSSFLKERKDSLDAGLRLSEVDKILEYFANVQNEFKTGIKELDDAGIVPTRGKIWFILASTGKGKTWALVQVGKAAFLQRKKVCHITLEVESEEVAQRYYQALFGVSKKDELNKIHTLQMDRDGKLDRIVAQNVEVPFTFGSMAIREELNTRLHRFGSRASNFIIKRFPMRSLTVDQLEAYLQSLEALDKFVPDMVILDYPGIMKTDAKNHRISMGRLVEDLRGLSQRRNFALVAAHQGNRGSADADLVKATHVAEDWSVIGSADFVVTYSQTSAEQRFGLARLFVDKARSEQDKFGVLVTQSYKTGQFVLESTRLSDSYAHIVEGMAHRNDEEETEESEED